MTVFASFGYVVAAPFHTDAAFSDLRNLDGLLDFVFLVTHLEQFNAMQALRPLALSKTLDYCSRIRNGATASTRREVGGFGASMGAESLLLLGGGKLTTTVTQQSMPSRSIRGSRRRSATCPISGKSASMRSANSQHGLDDVTLSFLGNQRNGRHDGAPDRDIARHRALAGPRELVTLAGVGTSSTGRRRPTSSRGR
jgi:hypothetical protein